MNRKLLIAVGFFVLGLTLTAHQTVSALSYIDASTVDFSVIARQQYGSVLGASTTGLVGYWKLDEDAGTSISDSSGGEKNLTMSGANWVAGNVGFALEFTGTSQVANNTSFNSITDYPLSISVWTANSGDNGSFRPAVAFGKSAMEYLGIGWSGVAGAGKANIVGRNAVFDAYVSPAVTGASTWTHVVGVFESPTKRILYVNGAEIASDTSAVAFPVGSNIISLGANPTSVSACNCKVDEVRVYNRALSAQEALDIYNDKPAPTADVLPPNISNIQITSITENSSVISWNTNELSDSRVEYGTTLSYGSIGATNSTLSPTHSVSLSGLVPATLYHLRVKSADASGNIGISIDVSFSTSNTGSSDVIFPVTTDSQPTGNGVTIKEMSASNQINRPYTFSRVFKQSEITNFPQARVAGELVLTQADVKNRWPDGSVKQAIISFITSIPANKAIFVDFVNQAGCNCGSGLTKEQMLGADYNFDAAMEFTPGGTVSARQILQDWNGVDTGINGQGVRLWMNGAIVTQVILEDRTTALKYDLSYNGFKSLHPYFIATFYSGTKEVKVEYISENVWLTAMQDISYSVRLKARGVEKYQKTGVSQTAGSRWRKTFWLGSEPQRVNINHNFPYMSSTMAIPNYDRSFQLDPYGLDVEINQYNVSDKGDIMGSTMTGNGDTFIDKAFPDGIEEGGMLPRAETKYLYTFDPRLHDVLFGDSVPGGGGLMAVWSHVPTHFRESDQALKYQDTNDDGTADSDSAFGRPVSIDARIATQIKLVYTDRVGAPAPVGAITNGGWGPDLAHQNNRQYLGYMITGDYYYLEEMMFWSSTNLISAGPGKGLYPAQNGSRWGNWGIFAEGFQTRGVAHAIRILGQLVFSMPDSMTEKKYFNQKLTNNLTAWEGYYGIKNGSFYQPCATSPYDYKTEKSKWCWGLKGMGQTIMGERNPLHLMSLGYYLKVPSVNPYGEVDGTKTSSVVGSMEWAYLAFGFSHLKELGFPTGKLEEFVGVNYINMAINPDFNPYLTDIYKHPLRQRPNPTDTDYTNDELFQTWTDYRQAYAEPNRGGFTGRRNNNGRTDYYAFEFIGALSFMTQISDGDLTGQSAYNWYKANFPYYSDFAVQPKWAFAPRVIGNVMPPISSDTAAPSVPQNLSATSTSATQINLTWTASTDNVGVAGYKIYRGGTQAGTTITNNYNDNSLSAATLYSYTVSAYDAAGNNSVQSSSVSATTKIPPVVLPVISNLVGSNTTATATKISWNTNVPTNGQVFYGKSSSYGLSSSLLDNITKTTTHTVTLTGLNPSTIYHFKVLSVDALNNSTSSPDFSFTTLSNTQSQAAPIISSFKTSSATIKSGSSAILSFSITGSTTVVTIDNGVGSVLGLATKTVSPVQTTTYTLSATNSAGIATAQVIVTVTAGDVNSSSVSGLVSPVVSSFSSVVSGKSARLSWTVSGYPTPIVSVNNGLGFQSGANITVSPTQTTTYTLTATNSAGTATAQITVVVVDSVVYIPPAVAPINPRNPNRIKLINHKGTYYLIQNNQRQGVTNPGMLYTYGYEFKDAIPATVEDESLPEGQLLLPSTGSLVKSKEDPTVYLVTQGERRGFVSQAVFKSLGFKFSSVLVVTNPELQALQKGENISNPNVAHSPGFDIIHNGTVYWIAPDLTRQPYPSLDVYNSWHRDGDFSQVVPANLADLELPVGGVVVPR